nr:MAG TPA: hypothetical protein [Bacteriophage sp.]
MEILYSEKQVQSLCSACDYAFRRSLPLGLAFQRSRFLQHFNFIRIFLYGEAILGEL